MGAYNLVPLQLRLRLHGGEGGKTAVEAIPGEGADVTVTAAAAAAAGGMKVIREVLECNPDAYRHGERGGTVENVDAGDDGIWMGGGETVFDAGEVGCVFFFLRVSGFLHFVCLCKRCRVVFGCLQADLEIPGLLLLLLLVVVVVAWCSYCCAFGVFGVTVVAGLIVVGGGVAGAVAVVAAIGGGGPRKVRCVPPSNPTFPSPQ